MTVIAGVVTSRGVVIGADRMASNCWGQHETPGKVFERDGWAFAAAGNPRTIQIFERVSRSTKLAKSDDLFDLAEEFFKKLKEAGLGAAEKNELQQHDSAFLIALSDALFMLDSNFGVYPHAKFCAHGIGGHYALGVIADAVRATSDFDGVGLIKRAIEVANFLSPHCGGGPDIARVEKRAETKIVSVISTEAGNGARKLT